MTPRGCLLIGNYPPPYGGVPRYIENLAPFLEARGWAVHVLSSGRSGVERRGNVTVHKLPLHSKLAVLTRRPAAHLGAPLAIRVRSAGDAVLRAWYHVLAAVGDQIVRHHRIDVICGFNLARGALIGAALGRDRGIPLVVQSFGELVSHEPFFRANPGLLPFICGAAARIVSGSRHCACAYRRFGLSPDVDVIPYGVDASRFHPGVDGSGARRRAGAGPEDVLVLFLGRHLREMGLHTLLAAVPGILAGSAAVRFVVAGGRGELTGEAHTAAARSGGRLVVMEDVPGEELPALYAAADLLAAPTAGDRACSSLAAAEALATGRPVVASAVGGIPELVGDGESGALIPPGDPAALTGAVLRLAGDPDGRRVLGARGRARIEAEWDTKVTLPRMEAVLAEAAGAAA